jgi:Tfp pilus assembly protein PilP
MIRCFVSTTLARSAGLTVLCAAIVALAGCGDDPPPPQQRTVSATPTAAATSGAAGGGSKTMLPEKMHIEDRVNCPIPDQPSDPKDGKCDPKAPACGEHLYCLTLVQGSFCEPCPERDGIRHSFKERDFVANQNRDPFRSFLTPQLPDSDAPVVLDPTKKCLRNEQMIAQSYGYADLKLVGIIALGTQRKVLMIAGREGFSIRRGDCVGKEKAFVKDIGTNYITFQIDPDGATANQRAAQEYSVELNPKQLAVNAPSELPPLAPRTSITPVVPPTAPPPRGPGPAPGPAAPQGSGSVTPPGASPAATPPAATPPAATPPAATPPAATPPAPAKRS